MTRNLGSEAAVSHKGCGIHASKRFERLGKGGLEEPWEIIRELITVLVFNVAQLACT